VKTTPEAFPLHFVFLSFAVIQHPYSLVHCRAARNAWDATNTICLVSKAVILQLLVISWLALHRAATLIAKNQGIGFISPITV
jgi:hypothetical protein